jgi:hypothetical protein
VISLQGLQLLLLVHVLEILHSVLEVRLLVRSKVVDESFIHVVRLIVVKVPVERIVKHQVRPIRSKRHTVVTTSESESTHVALTVHV